MAQEPVVEQPVERRWYRSAGLKIVSAIPLDELARTDQPGIPDITIQEGSEGTIDLVARDSTHVGVVGEVDAPWLEVRRGHGSYLARWPEKLDVVIPDDGSRLTVCKRGELQDSLARLLLCQGISFALPAHGREALHASAVEFEGRAIIIAGQSGRGKSTLATSLCMAGGSLLADDMACIRILNGEPVVEPTSTRAWLADELASTLAGQGSGKVMHRLNKVSVGEESMAVASEAVPLAAIFVLGYRAGGVEVSDPLEVKPAMTEVLGALFNFAINTPARMATQFEVTTRVIDKVPVRTLRWDPSPAAAPAVIQTMIEMAREGMKPKPAAAQPHLSTNGHGTRRARPAVSLQQDVIETLKAAGLGDVIEGDEEPLLRTSQVAALLRSSDRTIRSWADAGKLRYIKTLGGRRLFPTSGVMAVLQQMRSNYQWEE